MKSLILELWPGKGRVNVLLTKWIDLSIYHVKMKYDTISG